MFNKTESAWILTLAKKKKLLDEHGGKCVKCGETRPWVLVFHFLSSKIKNINTLKNRRMTVLIKEGEKCIVLCHNCHGELTGNNIVEITKHRENKKIMMQYLNATGCKLCGYSNNNASLHFHHIIPSSKVFGICEETKNFNFSSVDNLPISIKLELDKCMVLCGNCHSNLHFDIERYNKNKDEIEKKKTAYKELRAPLPKEEIKKLYLEGKTIKELSSIFGVNKSTICTITRKFNLGKSKAEISAEKKIKFDLVMSKYRLGDSVQEISIKTGINESTVKDYIAQGTIGEIRY